MTDDYIEKLELAGEVLQGFENTPNITSVAYDAGGRTLIIKVNAIVGVIPSLDLDTVHRLSVDGLAVHALTAWADQLIELGIKLRVQAALPMDRWPALRRATAAEIGGD